MSNQTPKIRAHVEFRSWTFTPWKGERGPNITGKGSKRDEFFMNHKL